MTPETETFPILDEELLLSLPKANKPQDMERIYRSPNSEDWVTWNLLRALQSSPDHTWWSGVVAAAEADAGRSERWEALGEKPAVELWRTVPSPPAYESASRQRMAASDIEEWKVRSSIARAVEGPTEVDLVFDGDEYLVFVEAKLHSDISMSTTYDPERNQIVRNIDCLIEQAGEREPFFWMLVDDRSPTRMYTKLLEAYRLDSSRLHHLLPHRDPAILNQIVESTAIVTWGDLLPLVPELDELAAIRSELELRVSIPSDSASEENHKPS